MIPPARARGDDGPEPGSDDPPALPVIVVRSRRRTRTVGAQIRDGVLRVSVPAWMSRTEEAQWVARMEQRFARRRSAERIDLVRRAARLADRHGLDRPASIRWADGMTTRWGSCTPATGSIRISIRLVPFPDWVIDYVIVHELAHLRVPGHGADFDALVARYPRRERAIGFLIAKSDGDGTGDDSVTD